MEFDTYNIVYLISNFFTIFIIQRFAEVFFSKQCYNKILSILAYFLFFIATSLSYFIFDIPIISLIVNWLTIFLAFSTYSSTIQKRSIYTTYTIAFMLFPELVVGAVTGYLHFSVFKDGSYSSEVGIIATKIITYIEVLVFNNIKSSKDNKSVSSSLWLATVIIPFTTLIYEIMFVDSNGADRSKMITSVALLFIINATAFYLYDALSQSYIKQSQIRILEKENFLYSRQCEIMQSSTEELQSFRHDMNNQFIAIVQLLNSKKYEEAEIQLQKLSELTKSKIIFSTSGNVIIDGLINYKLQNAVADNIKVKTEIAVSNKLPIDTTDIVTVIGNLLDNAIFALQSVPNDDRYLTLKVVESQQRFIIRISNPYCGQIFCKDGVIVTSKGDHLNHGYGLKNIAKTVDKYKGYMQIDYLNNIFTVDIIMYI